MSQEVDEKIRQEKYYNWEKQSKILANKIEGLVIKGVPLQSVAASVNSIALMAELTKEDDILKGVTITADISGEKTEMNYVDLHKWLIKKSLYAAATETKLGADITSIEVVQRGENPYQHPLTKSMGITSVDENFLLNNEILSEPIYKSLQKGIVPKDMLGTWNLQNFEKAVGNLAKYKKVRKLVHRGGKTFIATYYVNDLTTAVEEEEMDDKQHVHDLAKTGLDVGDDIVITNADGSVNKAKIRRFEADGSVRLLMDDGKKTNKKLADFALMVKLGKIQVPVKGGGTAPVPQSDLTTTLVFPKSLKDLKHVKSLGGSTGADLYEDKNGKQFVVKKGANGNQAINEVLTNNIYRTLGVNAPQSQLIDGALVSEYVGNVNDVNQASKGLEDTLRKQIETHYAAHALLANWDVVENDNSKYDPVSGTIWHLDNGGALLYRAQGGAKGAAFNGSLAELQTMRNMSSQQKKWFGKITDGDITAQIDNQILPQKGKILKMLAGSDLPAAEKAEVVKVMKERFTTLEKYSANYKSKAANINLPVKYDDATDDTISVSTKASKANNYKDLDMDTVSKDITSLIATNRKQKDDVLGFYDMNVICKARGFDGKPTVLNHDDFEKLYKKNANNDKVALAYRTVGSGYEDRFKNDVNFYTGGQGQSVHGAGIYFAAESKNGTGGLVPPPPNSNAFQDSRSYGSVTHYAIIPENFKWADESSIRNEISAVRNNQVANPVYDKLAKQYKKVEDEHHLFVKNYTDNVFKTHNYDKRIGDYIASVHQQRNWKEADVSMLAEHVKKAGGKINKNGQNMTIEMPLETGATTPKKFNFTFTGNDGTHKYNTMVKGMFNKVFDDYVTPITAKASTGNIVNDSKYVKLSTEKTNLMNLMTNTQKTVPNPKQNPADKVIIDLLRNHKADSEIGLFAAYKGYDGIVTTGGRYRTIFNRAKLILSNKDYQ